MLTRVKMCALVTALRSRRTLITVLLRRGSRINHPARERESILLFGRRDTSILMTSSLKDPADQLVDDSGESAGSRSGRHADAIFTNSYRKVLGQVSARKFLQTIMGKRRGDKSESYVKRQSDIYEGTFKEDLTSIQSNQRYRGVHGIIMRPRLLS
ncbi:somatoliberin isoform X1 [Notothenia coriiceps]|uniref:Somatoliberin n=1 Tax=Notothenia coriiceps TaxID=8208 RepID=A0A6I9MXH9_9TELE|nr:PREDICTED: somatoliberin isoform X1 [Notothenia coriiceps]